MIKPAIAAVSLLIASAASAAPLEQNAASAQGQFLRTMMTLQGLRGLVVPQAPVASAVAGAQSAPADVAELYFKAAKPAAADLIGWWSGRRKTSQGWVAALLVGAEFAKDTEQGPIAGSEQKAILFGDDKPNQHMPVDLWDNLGSVSEDAITWNLREKNKEWAALDLSGATGAVTAKGASRWEIRTDGRWLYVRYPNGDFGYFFKKVR